MGFFPNPFKAFSNPASGMQSDLRRDVLSQSPQGLAQLAREDSMNPNQGVTTFMMDRVKRLGEAAAGTGDYLPYTSELNAGMGRLTGLIDEVSRTEAPSRLLDAASYGARQEAAARGLEGGLAGSLGVAAQGQVRNAWEDQRHARMASLLSQQITAITGIQGAEQQRRMLMAQLKAAQAAGDQEKANKIWGLIGGLAGGGLALATGNPALAPMGFQVGYGVGSGASDIF